MGMVIRVWEASQVPLQLLEERITAVPAWVRDVEEHVKGILEEVKRRGDVALAEFTRAYDRVEGEVKAFKVERDEVQRAYGEVNKDQLSAIKFAKKRVEGFQRVLLRGLRFTWRDKNGLVRVRNEVQPIERVGCYVPGGPTPYVSTLIMEAVPAKVARVPYVSLCSPPMKNGQLHPLLLVAADICQVDELYAVGGAQAIAALAYGTETVKPVYKIVGPGNKFVTAAKILVSSHVAIDMPAGPSEIMVLADDTADPRLIALDMAAQAEHSPDSICGLITTSRVLANRVALELEGMVNTLDAKRSLKDTLARRGFITIFTTMKEAIEFVNRFAPEHLEVMTDKPRSIVRGITTAGMISIGPYSPVSASDYCVGANHILPTGGSARVYSNLSVVDFVKRVSLVMCSRKGLKRLAGPISILARSEQLPMHALAVEGRFGR